MLFLRRLKARFLIRWKMILQKQINVQAIIANRLVLLTKIYFAKIDFVRHIIVLNKISTFILQNSRKLFHINMTYWRVSKNPFPLALPRLSILCEKYFFPVYAVGRSNAVNQAHFSVRGTLLRWNNTRICESERWKNNDAARHYETAKRAERPTGPDVCVYWRSRDADFPARNASNRTHRVEKALIRGVWFFNARADERVRVCMQSTVGFSEAAATATAAWRHRREICIYQAGATNISFIICSERLICSPRRAASTCPPPVDPRRRPPRGPSALSLSSFPLYSRRAASRAILSLAPA